MNGEGPPEGGSDMKAQFVFADPYGVRHNPLILRRFSFDAPMSHLLKISDLRRTPDTKW